MQAPTPLQTVELLWYASRPVLYGVLPEPWYRSLARWRERRLPRTHTSAESKVGKIRAYFHQEEHVVHSLRPCDDLNCIFVHVPKTAGSVVSSTVFGYPVGHRTLSDYKDIFGDRFDDYFKFSIVRNPFSRVVSAYERARQPSFWGEKNGDEKSSADDGFAEFVLEELNQRAGRGGHFCPQVERLMVDGGLAIDYVAHFETLEEDFDTICEQLGVEAELPPEKDKDRPPLTAYYEQEEVADAVRTIYADDFSLLDYSRQVPGLNEEAI